MIVDHIPPNGAWEGRVTDHHSDVRLLRGNYSLCIFFFLSAAALTVGVVGGQNCGFPLEMQVI